MIEATSSSRVRAFGCVIIAGIYFYFAEALAGWVAVGSSYSWAVQRTILLLFLLIGYSAMGRLFQRQSGPLRAMGLVFRPGWGREFGLGAALGWGMLIASILPMVLTGGLIVGIWHSPRQFVLLAANLALLAIGSLAEEVAFRGYPFQRMIEAVGPFFATILFSLVFGLLHMFNPGATRASCLITVLSGVLLSVAYLRTRALWLCWGWHFAWNASMTLLFGLPLSGITWLSPVIQSDTSGPDWLTGGSYGPEASVVTGVVLLVGIIVLLRVTRDYAYRYAQPVIIPGGVPVEIGAHPEPATPSAGSKLVQIGFEPSVSTPRPPPDQPPN